MGGFELLVILIAFLYLANLTWIIRLIFSQRPEMCGFQPAVGFLTVCGTFVPYVGCITGAWYVLFGPTKWRSIARIEKFIAELTPDRVIDAMYTQIAKESLEGNWWVVQNVMPITQQELTRDLTGRMEVFRIAVTQFIKTYRHSLFGPDELDADWVGCYKRITYGGIR